MVHSISSITKNWYADQAAKPASGKDIILFEILMNNQQKILRLFKIRAALGTMINL
jgi:hypothetical protein